MKARPGIRAIFVREFRSAALQESGSLLLILSLFLVIERWKVSSGQVLEQIRPAMDAALLAVVALWGFATGARCFSEALKRRRFLYLYSLPLSRNRLWSALAAGRLTAGLVSLAVLFLVRPSLLQGIRAAREDISLALPWLLALYFVLLAAGLCFSQVFQRTTTACLVGYPAALILLLQALGYLFDGVPPARLWQSSANLVWLSAGALLLLLLLSWGFFVIGENAVRRRSLLNQISLAMILSGTLMTVGAASRLAWPEGPWLQTPPRYDPDSASFPTYKSRPVSAGGRYLAVVERLYERPGYSRLHVIETATGRILETRRWRGLRWAGWSGQREVLQVVISPTAFHDPWAVREPEATWIRLEPSGRELSRRRLGVFVDASFADGATLLLDRQKTEGRLLRLEGNGRTILLARVSSPENAQISSLRRQGALLASMKEPWNAWHIVGPSARELRRPDAAPSINLISGDFAMFSSENTRHDFKSENLKHFLFGPLPGRWDSYRFVDPSPNDYLVLGPTVSAFALSRHNQALSLWVRRLGSSGWIRLSRGLSLDANKKEEERRGSEITRRPILRHIQVDQKPSISFLDRLALYLPMGGADGRAAIYDGALDREIPLPTCRQGKAALPELISARDERTWLLRFRCIVPSPLGVKIEFRHFYYLPGSGQPQDLSALDREIGEEPILLAYLDERTAIWRPEEGETWKILRDGQIRTLWPPHN